MPTPSWTLVAFSRRKDAEGEGVAVLSGEQNSFFFFFSVNVEEIVCRIKIWEAAALVGGWVVDEQHTKKKEKVLLLTPKNKSRPCLVLKFLISTVPIKNKSKIAIKTKQ